MREVLGLLGVLTGDPDIKSAFEQPDLTRKDGAISMESVWSRTMKEKLNEGISIGEARGRSNVLNELISKGIITPEQAAQL